MDNIWDFAYGEITQIALTLVSTFLLPYVAFLIRKFIYEKIQAVKDDELRQGLEWAFERLDHTAETVVMEIEQTVRKKLNLEPTVTHGSLFQAAFNRAYDRLPKPAMQILLKSYNQEQIAKIVKSKIESKVATKTKPPLT